jgi:NHL repeat
LVGNRTADCVLPAGDGAAGYSGDGGPAVAAELSSPEGVAVDRSGDLVIGDGGNGRVRIVRS